MLPIFFHSCPFDSSWFQRKFIPSVKCLKFLLHHEKNSWTENYKLISFCIKIGFWIFMNVYIASFNDIKKLEHFLQSSMILTPCLYNPKIASAPSTWSFLLVHWGLSKGKNKCIKKREQDESTSSSKSSNFQRFKKEGSEYFLLL